MTAAWALTVDQGSAIIVMNSLTPEPELVPYMMVLFVSARRWELVGEATSRKVDCWNFRSLYWRLETMPWYPSLGCRYVGTM